MVPFRSHVTCLLPTTIDRHVRTTTTPTAALRRRPSTPLLPRYVDASTATSHVDAPRSTATSTMTRMLDDDDEPQDEEGEDNAITRWKRHASSVEMPHVDVDAHPTSTSTTHAPRRQRRCTPYIDVDNARPTSTTTTRTPTSRVNLG